MQLTVTHQNEQEILQHDQKIINLQECLIHELATSIGKPDQRSSVCQCCGMKYQKQFLKINFGNQELAYLGPGLTLYLMFFKICFVLVFLISIISSINSLYNNFLGNACGCCPSGNNNNQISVCSSNTILSRLSILNKIDGPTSVFSTQSYLVNTTVFVLLIVLQILKQKNKSIKVNCESKLDQSGFAVLLHMPTSSYTQSDIRKSIQQWWKIEWNKHHIKLSQKRYKCQQEFYIQKILISYELSELNKLEKQLGQLKQQVNKKHSIVQNYSYMEKLKEEIEQRRFFNTKKSIVVFRYPEQKRYILMSHSRNFFFLSCFQNIAKFNNEPIRFQNADLPKNINWKYHSLKGSNKKRVRFAFLLIILTLVTLFDIPIYLLLNSWLVSLKNSLIGVPIIISLYITLLTPFFYYLSEELSRNESHASVQKERVSKICKNILFICLFNGISLLVIFILNPTVLWTNQGFLDTISYVFFLIIIPHLIYVNLGFFNFNKIWYKIKGYFVKKSYSQKEINELYERRAIKFDQNYSWLISIVWLVCIFTPLVPMVSIIACILIPLHYLVQKLNIVYFYRQPENEKHYINDEMIELLQWTPFWLCLSNLFTDLFIFNNLLNVKLPLGNLIFDLVILIITLLIFLISPNIINQFFNFLLCEQPEKFALNFEYSTNQNQFITTYQKQNPVYRYKFGGKREDIYEKLQQELERLTHEISNTLRQKNNYLVHPLKYYNITTKDEESIDFYYETPFTPRMQREGMVRPPIVSRLPINRQVQRMSENSELNGPISFRKVFKDLSIDQKEKLINRIKNRVEKLQK